MQLLFEAGPILFSLLQHHLPVVVVSALLVLKGSITTGSVLFRFLFRERWANGGLSAFARRLTMASDLLPWAKPFGSIGNSHAIAEPGSERESPQNIQCRPPEPIGTFLFSNIFYVRVVGSGGVSPHFCDTRESPPLYGRLVFGKPLSVVSHYWSFLAALLYMAVGQKWAPKRNPGT